MFEEGCRNQFLQGAGMLYEAAYEEMLLGLYATAIVAL